MTINVYANRLPAARQNIIGIATADGAIVLMAHQRDNA